MTSRVVLLALALAVCACGADAQRVTAADAAAPDADQVGVACVSDPAACVAPPPQPPVPPNTSGTRTVIAVSRLYLGESPKDAWRTTGYDLDGLVSHAGDVNHCALSPGAHPSVMTDLDGGVDNSWGAHLLQLVTSLSSDPSSEATTNIQGGHATVLIALDNVLDPIDQPNQTGITGGLYSGADKGTSAAFDGTDVWPVTFESVDGGHRDKPRIAVTDSYVKDGVWVSATRGILAVRLVDAGYVLDLPIANPVVSMRLVGVGAAASAVHGVIAGEIDTEAMIHQMVVRGGCTQPTFDSIAQQIRQASDIMSDGTNGDPGKTCDAISIGLGFNGAAVQLGAVAPPVVPPPDPCAPAP